MNAEMEDIRKMLLDIEAHGYSIRELTALWDVCLAQAQRSASPPIAFLQILHSRITQGLMTRKEVLQLMEPVLVITTRELKEVAHAMYYAQNLAHGTTGHNQLMLLDKLATHLGFHFSNDGRNLEVPTGVRVDDGPQTKPQTAG